MASMNDDGVQYYLYVTRRDYVFWICDERNNSSDLKHINIIMTFKHLNVNVINSAGSILLLFYARFYARLVELLVSSIFDATGLCICPQISGVYNLLSYWYPAFHFFK